VRSYIRALPALSANRFILAGLSAALPHTVSTKQLVVANAFSPPAGTVATAAGGIISFVVHLVVHNGEWATAATLIPAIAAEAGHVTMLQRSPTYFIPGRNENELYNTLVELDIDPMWIHEFVRRKVLYDQAVFTRRATEESDVVRDELLAGVRAFLGPDYPVEKDFTPSYRPWRQRIAG